MGTLEQDALKDRRKGYLQQAVLSTVAVTGLLAVALLAPNILQLLGGNKKSRFRERTKQAATRLAGKGFIKFVSVDGRKHLQITEEGRRFLELEKYKMQLRAESGKPRRWDKHWRIVMFDVPERKKAMRDSIRHQVSAFGFLRLQDSVWIYPYDCEDLIALLKADLHIGKDLLYAIVEKIENDKWIRQHFHLA